MSLDDIPIFDNPLKVLSKDNKITLQQILNNLLDAKENLELKTHIFKPKALAGLKTIAIYLENIGLKHSSKCINNYIETYLKYMVSYKRKSRTEIIKAFTFSNSKEYNENAFTSKLD